MSHHSTQLLIIDPQNDFCDLPDNWLPAYSNPGMHPEPILAPVLPVSGAHEDMLRLAGWIAAHAAGIDQITITLDSHQSYDIAHPAFWQQRNGASITPFTQITAAQVRAGEFAPRNSVELARTLAVNTLVFGQLFYLFNSRHLRSSSLRRDTLLANRVAWGAAVVLLWLQITYVYAPFMHRLFASAPLSPWLWLIPAGIGLAVFFAVELEKKVVARRVLNR